VLFILAYSRIIRGVIIPPHLSHLPAPAPEAQALSDQLSALIAQEIATAGGWISFARYMELALYAPGLGYYSAGSRKLGESGDFVTAPEMSPLFARCIALQLAQLHGDGLRTVLEIGSGSGALAAELLLEMEALGCAPERYLILELSGDLRERQQQTIAQRAPALLERVQWLDVLPMQFDGVILANEVLDATPAHWVRTTENGIEESGVALSDSADRSGSQSPPLSRLGAGEGRGEGRGSTRPPAPAQPHTPTLSPHTGRGGGVVKLCRRPRLATEELLAAAASLDLPPHYETEINLTARALVTSLAHLLTRGVMLFIDYGFPAREFYHPQRNQGTLMCHYRHHAHDDPFAFVGLQDITTHVDFSAIAAAALEGGAGLLGYTTQANFLINCGITELLSAIPASDTRAYAPLAAQAQKLLSPAEMGELFKVIALGKNLDAPLLGFSRGDKSHTL
jgi:SAM-dependent MidA family methyltransferase